MLINKRPGESYQHAAARTVMLDWLRKSGGKFGPLDWQSGREWEEYPFIEEYLPQCLSEVGPNIPMANPPIPTYEELVAHNIRPIAIADIVCIHKGSPVYAIEIVHKNEISEKKISTLKKLQCGMELEICRVEAHWILSQIDYPTNFPEYGIRMIK